MKGKVVILTLEGSADLRESSYLIQLCRQRWEEDGLECEQVRNLDKAVPADIAIMHVDLTRIPKEYLEYAADYPVVLNQRVTDVSRDRYSRLLLRQGDDWNGAVIIKTLANYGGVPELHRSLEQGDGVMQLEDVQRPWRKRQYLESSHYPVFSSIHEVPPGVWRNPLLVVEKLLFERGLEGRYTLRNWIFLGDRELNTYHTGPGPVVKAPPPWAELEKKYRPVIPREPVPQALRDLRDDMGFDYGRFDYAIVDGEAVIYDVNRTTAILDAFLHAFAQEIHEELPRGLYAYL